MSLNIIIISSWSTIFFIKGQGGVLCPGPDQSGRKGRVRGTLCWYWLKGILEWGQGGYNIPVLVLTGGGWRGAKAVDSFLSWFWLEFRGCRTDGTTSLSSSWPGGGVGTLKVRAVGTLSLSWMGYVQSYGQTDICKNSTFHHPSDTDGKMYSFQFLCYRKLKFSKSSY